MPRSGASVAGRTGRSGKKVKSKISEQRRAKQRIYEQNRKCTDRSRQPGKVIAALKAHISNLESKLKHTSHACSYVCSTPGRQLLSRHQLQAPAHVI